MIGRQGGTAGSLLLGLVLLARAAMGGARDDADAYAAPPRAAPAWYNPQVTAAFTAYLDSKLAPYERRGLGPRAVDAAMDLGACADGCDVRERRWNAHFQIINGTVLGVGGYGVFWNDHHRKRVKAVVTILRELVRLDPQVPDVEFVVNMHDYNKLLREPATTLAWGTDLARASGLEGLDAGDPAEDGGGGRAGSFREHLPLWNGSVYDWSLHYRIYGNHFGNELQHQDADGAVDVAIFSATSCAFSYDISFPTSFYDFERMDAELDELDNKSTALFPWPSKIESAVT
jgi:hypothetical protein